MSRAEFLAKFDKFGIAPTPQRLEVASILLDKPQHLSADQVIEKLREKGSKVSKATVYNSLNLFGKRGLVKECLVDSERRLYDSRVEPHHHYYDVESGQLTDIAADDIEILGLPALPEGTVCDGVELIVRVRPADG
jgi:Fur family iron response transcriptional regulator